MKLHHDTSIDQDVLSLIWNHTNDAIFTIGYDGQLLATNPAFSSILGWDKEDLENQHFFSFFLNTTEEEQRELLNTFKKGQDVPYYVTKRVSKNGNVIDILASYCAVNKKDILAVGMYKDFTEQMEIQRKLQASQYCYRNLVEFIPDAIFVENDEKIRFINKTGLHILGVQDENDILGQPIWQFIAAENRLAFKSKIAQAIASGESIIEQVNRIDGKIIWVEITIMRVLFEDEYVNQIMMRDITAKKHYEAQLEYLAFHDPLTGLSNRCRFMGMFSQVIEQATKQQQMLSVIYLDIDKFKSINDTFGHDAGDQLLVQFANLLKQHARQEDIICRIGGDEFLILLQDIRGQHMVIEIIEKLQQALATPILLDNQPISITVSMGAALFPQDGTDAKVLIAHADTALYQAKEQRNTYRFYEGDYA